MNTKLHQDAGGATAGKGGTVTGSKIMDREQRVKRACVNVTEDADQAVKEFQRTILERYGVRISWNVALSSILQRYPAWAGAGERNIPELAG